MRIPGGDLAPARRRRYGGSYGRRRKQRGRGAAVLVLLLAVGGGAYYYLQHNDKGVPQRLTQAPSSTPCPTPLATKAAPASKGRVVLPPPTAVTVTVLNGTNRSLLAKHVADELAADGFHITRQGNAARTVTGASEVAFGPGAAPQANTVSNWVPGSVLVATPKAARGSVELVLGSSYTRLATPAEAAAAQHHPATAASPTVSASPKACGS